MGDAACRSSYGVDLTRQLDSRDHSTGRPSGQGISHCKTLWRWRTSSTQDSPRATSSSGLGTAARSPRMSRGILSQRILSCISVSGHELGLGLRLGLGLFAPSWSSSASLQHDHGNSDIEGSC